MTNGSKKGSSFERTICKQLSRWWTRNERDDIFWRTPGSGARATTRMKKQMKTEDSAGDIMAIDKSGKPFTQTFLVEIKRGYSKKISLLSFIDSSLKRKKKPILYQWWEKATKERKEHKRKWNLIIFKRDRKIPCICFSQEAFDFFVRPIQKNKFIYSAIFIDNYKLIILPLELFLKIIKIKQFKKKINKIKVGK